MKFLQASWEWLKGTQVPVGLVILLFVVWFVAFTRSQKPSVRREPQMDPNARMTKIRETISDGLLHRVLLPMLETQQITGEEFDYFCKRFRDQSKLSIVWRFISKPYNAYRLKAEIKRRLPEVKQKVVIPGDPPPDIPAKKANGKLAIPTLPSGSL